MASLNKNSIKFTTFKSKAMLLLYYLYYICLYRYSDIRSHILYIWQYTLPQDLRSSMRLPLQTSRPFWEQYRQIACWTNRGKDLGKAGLNCRASICSDTVSMMLAQPPGR